MNKQRNQGRLYVEKLRSKGFSDQEIRQRLRQAGWRDEEIDSLLRSQMQPTIPKPPPPPAVRESAGVSDVSTAAKAGIIIASVLMPIVGIIWGIVYLTSGQSRRRTWGIWALVISIGISGLVLLTVAGFGPIAEHARSKAEQTACLANIKQLVLGTLMYADDHRGYLPNANRWEEAIWPYVANDMVFRCPSGGTYAMAPKLSGMRISQIPNPAETILLYEVDNSGNPLSNVHLGEANYAFVNGSCRAMAEPPKTF